MNMKMISQKAKGVAAVALLTLTLAACGSTATTTTTATSASQSVAVATTVPAATSASQSVAVATIAPAATAASADTTAPTAASSDTTSAATTTVAKLNLNTVTSEQLLATIPNFSSRMVREFDEYRPYVSIQQFRKEIGKYVSADQVTAYEQYVYVPIDVNSVDAATIQQIPGVDATEASALIDSRPFASNDAFLQALSAYVTPEQQAIAATYLAQ